MNNQKLLVFALSVLWILISGCTSAPVKDPAPIKAPDPMPAPSNVSVNKYPLESTEFLKSAYCWHMSLAPRLEIDLTDQEKRKGQDYFIITLVKMNLEFPQGNDYEKIKSKFATWAVNKFPGADQNEIIYWYKSTCLN